MVAVCVLRTISNKVVGAGSPHVQTEEMTMPSKSPKQKRLMAGAAHNKKFADKVGVPQSVAREFNRADQKSQPKKSGTRKR